MIQILSSARAKFVVAGVGVALSVAAAGSYSAAQTSPVSSPTPAAAPNLPADTWKSMTAAQRSEALAALPAEQKAGMATFLDQMGSGRVPVSGAGGQRLGYVDVRALNLAMPRSRADLVPITDESGTTVVAYWAGPLGAIDKQSADGPDLDLAARAARLGLNPDGTLTPGRAAAMNAQH